jgi:hypothetical protein
MSSEETPMSSEETYDAVMKAIKNDNLVALNNAAQRCKVNFAALMNGHRGEPSKTGKRGEMGETWEKGIALVKAVRRARVALVARLLELGAEPGTNTKFYSKGWVSSKKVALLAAVKANSLECVNLFLNYRTPPLNGVLEGAIRKAKRSTNQPMIDRLVEAETMIKNQRMIDRLVKAERQRIIETISEMIELGPDPPTDEDSLYERIGEKHAEETRLKTEMECCRSNMDNWNRVEACSVFMDKPCDTLFNPCAHRNTCWESWKALEASAVADGVEPKCPTCRVVIKGAVRLAM